MTSSNYAYQTLDDIVFEGRNREYGAYLLRQVYTRNLWRGLVTAISLFLLFLSIPLLVQKFWPEEAIVEQTPHKDAGLQIIEITLPELPPVAPPPATEIKPPAPAEAVPMERFTAPVITAKPQTTTNVPEQQTLSQTNIGTETVAGDNTLKPPVTETEGTTGTGTGEATQPAVFFSADQMPEYPGGLGAMKKFLADNIVYPLPAHRSGLEGTVLLSFVVNQNGDISGIQVLRTPGMGLEAEAIRVLKSMPRWSPGKNNGVPVNVRFTLPITFAIR